MGHSVCCVVGCKNTGRNSKYKFYRFPEAVHTLQQRQKWIIAIKRKNADGTLWTPKPTDRICSQHFIGDAKSANQYSPSYAPTLFPPAYTTRKVDALAAMSRHTRFMNRRLHKERSAAEGKLLKQTQMTQDEDDGNNELGKHVQDPQIFYVEQECQVNFLPNCTEQSKTFICNRYVYSNGSCDAETQINIFESTGLTTVPNLKKYKDKKCGTEKKTFQDQSIGSDSVYEEPNSGGRYFAGYSSIKSDHQRVDLAGTTCHNFKFLLKSMPESEKWRVTQENRLLILLFKWKTGLPFSAISVLFSLHRTTVSKIFLALCSISFVPQQI